MSIKVQIIVMALTLVLMPSAAFTYYGEKQINNLLSALKDWKTVKQEANTLILKMEKLAKQNAKIFEL